MQKSLSVLIPKTGILLAGILLAGIFWVANVAASVPFMIPVQGILASSQGVAVEGETEITFAIHDAQNGGVELWAEQHPAVLVAGGFFSVYLGDITPIDPGSLMSASELWLSITVGAEELSRISLAAMPFAFECVQIGSMAEEDIQPRLIIDDSCPTGQFISGWNNGAPVCDTPASTTASLSCEIRRSAANVGSGTSVRAAYMACNTGEVLTGGGCSTVGTVRNALPLDPCPFCFCILGAPCAPSSVKSRGGYACFSNDLTNDLFAYAVCCKVE